MKNLKNVLAATVLSVAMVMPVFASEALISPTAAPVIAPMEFTAADTQSLFEQNAQPMQLAVLSQQEMKETEGARVNFGALTNWAFRPGGWANSNRYLRVGWGTHNNHEVFRVSGNWVPQRFNNGHINLYTGNRLQ